MEAIKKISVFCFLVVSLAVNAAGIADYAIPSDVYELVYQVASGKGTVGRAYRTAWESKNSYSGQIKSDFSRFQEISDAYKVPYEGEEEVDLFGKKDLKRDLVASIFHHGKNLNDVYKKLMKAGVPQGDVQFMINFFKTHKTQLLDFLKESSQFNVKVLSLNKEWKYKSYGKAFKKAEAFILSKEMRKKFDLKLRPVWWPANEPPRIDFNGDVLLLRYNPLSHTNNWNLPVIMEKAIEALLHAQGDTQRSNLTKIFKSQCPGRELELRSALGTMFSVMMPQQFESKKTFSVYEKWGSTHFIDIYLKLLYPLMEEEMKKRASFAGEFMEKASTMCRSINNLSVVP